MEPIDESRPWDAFEPLNGYMIVEREKQPEMVGQIALPETAMVRGETGRIRKTSEELNPLVYWNGRRVVLLPFTGTEIGARGAALIFVLPQDLISFVEEDACPMAEGT